MKAMKGIRVILVIIAFGATLSAIFGLRNCGGGSDKPTSNKNVKLVSVKVFPFDWGNVLGVELEWKNTQDSAVCFTDLYGMGVFQNGAACNPVLNSFNEEYTDASALNVAILPNYIQTVTIGFLLRNDSDVAVYITDENETLVAQTYSLS